MQVYFCFHANSVDQLDTLIQILSFLLLLAAMIAITVSFSLLKRGKNYLRSFAGLLLTIACWAFGYGMELASSTLSTMLLWINVEYVGIAFLPACWLIFILQFSGQRNLLTTINQIIFFFIPTLTLLLVWTNHWHHWHYEKVAVVTLSGIPLLSLTAGVWYNIHTIYFYLLMAIGIAVLYTTKSHSILYQKQRNIITAAALVPWLFNMLYLTRFRPLEHLDITPVAFLLTMAIIGYGLYRHRLMNLLPLARAKVMQAMQEGVIILDPSLRISDFNLASEQHLQPGYVISIGNSLTETDDISLLVEQLLNNADQEVETILEFPDAQRKILTFSLTCVYHQEEIEGYLLLVRNVTKEKLYIQQIAEQAEALKDLNQYKDKLFSIIAHDLKGPVHRLSTLFDFLEDGALSEVEVTQAFRQLRKETSSTYLLLENLLYWSQNQFQGMSVSPTAFCFHDITNALIHQASLRAQEKQLVLDNKIEPNTLVCADVNMIMIVIRNILSNAIKFSRPDGRIILRSQKEATEVLVCIEDEGVGMSEEQLSGLFSQPVSSTPGTYNEKGTGLGLQLCKQLIDKNHGKIWGESTEGKGSRFFIKLPLVSPSWVQSSV